MAADRSSYLIVSLIWWRGQDSNLRSPFGRQIYSLLVLTAHPPLQRATPREPRLGDYSTGFATAATQPLRVLLASRPDRTPLIGHVTWTEDATEGMPSRRINSK